MDSDDFVIAMAAVQVSVDRARRALFGPRGFELIKSAIGKIAQHANAIATVLMSGEPWMPPDLLPAVHELAASLDELVVQLNSMSSLDAGDVDMFKRALEQISIGAGELMEKATRPEQRARP